MNKFLSTCLVLSFLFIAAPSHAQMSGQQQCNERGNVITLLAKKYKESPIAAGVTNTGGLIEILTDPNNGTWTIIVSTPPKNGMQISCLVAAGEGFRLIQQKDLKGQES